MNRTHKRKTKTRNNCTVRVTDIPNFETIFLKTGSTLTSTSVATNSHIDSFVEDAKRKLKSGAPGIYETQYPGVVIIKGKKCFAVKPMFNDHPRDH